MRLQESRKRDLTYRPCTEAGDVYTWGAGVQFRATLQPAGGKLLAELYGVRLEKMKLLLYDGSMTLAEGAGICVDVAGTAPCDYHIAAPVEPWLGHQRALVEWIPPGRRA